MGVARAPHGGSSERGACSAYDLDGLDDRVIEAAQHSQQFVTEESTTRRDAALDAERASRDAFDGELASPAGDVKEMCFAAAELGALRRLLAAWAAHERLAAEPTEELVLAVNELATNSVRYGGGSGTMLLWRERDTLLCEIRDLGYIEDPLLGRTRPAPEDPSGRGIWLVHQLCDVVQIHSAPGGTAVRVHKHL
jgi:anti-sigma regulatory factor (Ser/Thr protein kinase)